MTEENATRKVVVNRCYGGFSLSRAAVKRMAELRGRECYFFGTKPGDLHTYVPSSEPDNGRDLFWTAFDIPNPNEVLAYPNPWQDMTDEERVAHNALYERHSLNNRPEPRDDALLVQVVAELGEAANGACAELEVVEIPAEVEWTIEEYDGREWVSEAHRTW